MEQWEALKPTIKQFPHPNKFFAEQGKTYLDYQEFALRSCGTSGTIRNLKKICAVNWQAKL